MDVLNNREWSILIWFTALALYLGLSPRMREVRGPLVDVIQSFFVWKIQALLFLALFYVSFLVYCLHEIDLWHIGQLKNTMIWFFAVAFLSFFDLEKYKNNSGLFKKTVLDNIKLIALVEFLIGFYVLPFWAELILFPVLVFITMLHAFSQADKMYKSVENLFGMILSIFGLSLIIYALYELVTNFSEFAKPETAEDFLLPPFLTLAYLPLIFFLVVYTTYENIFVTLQFSVKDKWVKRFTKAFALIVFNFHIKDLERWVWMLQVRDINNLRDVLKAWQDFSAMRRVERNPPSVSKTEGWSPYEAQEFLKNQGVETGHYKELQGDWFASAPYVEFGDGIIKANFAYYIDGNSRSARSLKVTVNVNDSKDADIAREKMLDVVETLFQKSTNQILPEKIKEAIISEENMDDIYDLYSVSFEKDAWPNHRLNGYSLRFCIAMLEGDLKPQIA
ncbi:hypothetical protein A3197_14425 [Candidatus Thiodiazotropha endoloripes]|nr:hypothetical protein A3197_14425 [Candidatus Thiodiazotropha endoloripes]